MKLRTYLLLSGLLLKIIAVVLNVILGDNQDLTQTPFGMFVQGESIWKMFFWVCLVAPIVEEFSFRYWTRGGWIAKVASLVGMSMFVFTIFNWIFAVITAVVLAGLMFGIRGKCLRVTVLAIVTSLLFGVCHVNIHDIGVMANIMSLVGLGLIAVYFALRWNIWAAIALHAFNNVVALVLTSQIMLFSPETKVMEARDFRVEMKQVQSWALSAPQISINMTDSTVDIKNATISQIVKELGVGTSEYMLINNYDLRMYDFKAVLNNKFTTGELKDSLISRLNIVFDTIGHRKDLLRVTFSEDVMQGRFKPNCSVFVSMPTLQLIVRRNFQENLVSETDRVLICMTQSDFDELTNANDFNELVAMLAENGVYIKSSGDSRFIVIRSIDI